MKTVIITNFLNPIKPIFRYLKVQKPPTGYYFILSYFTIQNSLI